MEFTSKLKTPMLRLMEILEDSKMLESLPMGAILMLKLRNLRLIETLWGTKQQNYKQTGSTTKVWRQNLKPLEIFRDTSIHSFKQTEPTSMLKTWNLRQMGPTWITSMQKHRPMGKPLGTVRARLQFAAFMRTQSPSQHPAAITRDMNQHICLITLTVENSLFFMPLFGLW